MLLNVNLKFPEMKISCWIRKPLAEQKKKKKKKKKIGEDVKGICLK